MTNNKIKKSFTITGRNASHFGNGKIDALAGIGEIVTRSIEKVKGQKSSLNQLAFALFID